MKKKQDWGRLLTCMAFAIVGLMFFGGVFEPTLGQIAGWVCFMGAIILWELNR